MNVQVTMFKNLNISAIEQLRLKTVAWQAQVDDVHITQ